MQSTAPRTSAEITADLVAAVTAPVRDDARISALEDEYLAAAHYGGQYDIEIEADRWADLAGWDDDHDPAPVTVLPVQQPEPVLWEVA